MFCTLNEPCLYLQLTQIIMGVLSISSVVQLWLTSEIPCLPVVDVFSSVCVLHVVESSPSRARCLLSVHNIQNYPIFEPSLSFLCVRVNVEMTSVVELFSDHFSFSVKSGMWTEQCCPFRTLACAACELLIMLSHYLKSKSNTVRFTKLKTSLGQYGLRM